MTMNKEKHDNKDDLPMPKVAAVSGWITLCVICFSLIFLGKAIGYAFTQKKMQMKTNDAIIAIVAGTFLFVKNKKHKS